MVTVSEALFAQFNTICEMTIPVVALSQQTFAFRIKPHLILFSISSSKSSVPTSESCWQTQGLFVLLLPHWSGTGRIAFLCFSSCCPGRDEQMEGAGASFFSHRYQWPLWPFLVCGNLKKRPSHLLILFYHIPVHAYIHHIYVFKWNTTMVDNYVNINSFQSDKVRHGNFFL